MYVRLPGMQKRRSGNIRVLVPAMMKLIQRQNEKIIELEGKINDLMSEYNGRSV